MCFAVGKITAATVADHIEDHHGNWNAFWTGALQSLCAGCHGHKKAARDYTIDIGLVGYPLDPRHPAYRMRQGTAG
jgi:5-methylcytosine-specific restriction enzyme A